MIHFMIQSFELPPNGEPDWVSAERYILNLPGSKCREICKKILYKLDPEEITESFAIERIMRALLRTKKDYLEGKINVLTLKNSKLIARIEETHCDVMDDFLLLRGTSAARAAGFLVK